jgi:hypothetical protein
MLVGQRTHVQSEADTSGLSSRIGGPTVLKLEPKPGASCSLVFGTVAEGRPALQTPTYEIAGRKLKTGCCFGTWSLDSP